MPKKSRNGAKADRIFLLDKSKRRRRRFSSLHPKAVSTLAGLRDSLSQATRDSLWISYEKGLTEALVRNLNWPSRTLGRAVLVHATNPETLPVLSRCFSRFVFGANASFLPPEELAEALAAENRDDLIIGGSVDPATNTVTLWRRNLEPLTVPFSAFERSGDGIEPNFDRFSVTDFGQSVRLGEYEAAVDALLYEFDPEYRRRIARERRATERTIGAAIRRLRKQRGLRREDFAPAVASKTIARIEQGKIQNVRPRTLQAIADRLRVRPDDLATY